MSKTYSGWLGRQVVLQIEAGEALIPLRGLVVNESNDALRFRLDGGWEVDIYKEMILRVEADNYEPFQLRNWEASNKTPIGDRSDEMPMLRWYGFFNRWCSKHCSWRLSQKVICSAGLAGTVLFVLALHMNVSGPITQSARFIGGYLGLLLCAVALGCEGWVLIDAITAKSHFFARWSKRFASFLDWFRQPIHL